MTTTAADQEKTGLGNYFIANYPPFSFWKPSFVPDAERALSTPPAPPVPLGLYLHIPFCRKRCKFCYFRVYTDKNAKDIEVYLDALLKEVELLSKTACVGGRRLDYVYSAAARRLISAHRNSTDSCHDCARSCRGTRRAR